MKPRYFLASKSGHSTSLYLKLLKTVEADGLTVIEPTARPRKIELGSIELTIFPQPPEDRKEENNNSIGLRVKYGSFSVLLTGDSEETERQWWLKHDPELVRDCTILKLPHHGSRNGTDARWLQAVRPELAVASLGKNNDYGHPHSETISLLRRIGNSALAHRPARHDHDHERRPRLAGGRADTGAPRTSHAGGYRPRRDHTRRRSPRPGRLRPASGEIRPDEGCPSGDGRRNRRVRSIQLLPGSIGDTGTSEPGMGLAIPPPVDVEGPSVGAPACGLGA